MAAEKTDSKTRGSDAVKLVVRNFQCLVNEAEDSTADWKHLPHCFDHWNERIETHYCLQNVDCMGQSQGRRVYMGFKTTQDAMEFHREFDGSFVEDNQLMIELAPYPKLPRAQRLKQDTKQSTIEQDTEYLAFAETYEADNLAKVKDVGAKSHQEKLLLDLENRAKEKKEAEAILTPLIQSIVDSRSKKDEQLKLGADETSTNKKRRDVDVVIAGRKKRDEERRRVLEQKEKALKERQQREKEKQEKQKMKKEADEKRATREINKNKENYPRNKNSGDNLTGTKPTDEKAETTDEKKLELQDIESNGDAQNDSAKDSARSTDSAKSSTFSANSANKPTRLKDLPSLQIYRPGAKAKHNDQESPPEDRSSANSFLDRDHDSSSANEQSGVGTRGGGGGSDRSGGSGGGGGGRRERNGGRAKGFREIKPSNRGGGNSSSGTSSASSSYPSSRGGERRKEPPKKEQQPPNAIRYYTSKLAEAKKEKDKDDPTSSKATRDDFFEKEGNEAENSRTENVRSEVFNDNSGRNSARNPNIKDPSSRNSKAQRANPERGNRRNDDYDWNQGYDDGYSGGGFYDRGTAGFHGSSWNSRNRGPPSSSSKGYDQYNSYSRSGMEYSGERYGNERSAVAIRQQSARISGGGNLDRRNPKQGFSTGNEGTKATKSDEPSKPPRFSDRRRATAASNNISDQSERP